MVNTLDWFLTQAVSRNDSSRGVGNRAPDTLDASLDGPSYRHGVLLACYGDLILRELRIDDSNGISIGIALHDVGKTVVQPDILLKPDRLTSVERQEVEKHSKAGYDLIVSRRKRMEIVAQPALGHHERYDGLGYPLGLSRNEIPIGARVASVIDVFDALLTARPYKTAWDLEAVVDFIGLERARRFDANVADVVLHNVDQLYSLHKKNLELM